MGKKSRTRRAGLKLIIGQALKRGDINIPVKQALKLLRSEPESKVSAPELERYWRRLRGIPEPDVGYKENEFGELRSTIKKLTEHEIIDRMCAKATYEIHSIEDAHVFAQIEQAIAGVELGA